MSETLGDRMRVQRARLRLSQRALAARVLVSTNAINAIEGGRVDPRSGLLHRIAKALGVSMDYLLGDTDDPQPGAAGGAHALALARLRARLAEVSQP